MLRIAAGIRDGIVAHARKDHPDEACGFLVGPAGSAEPTRYVEMTNVARSTTFHEMDSGELLAVFKELDARDEELLAHYHSHTATEPYPSRTDITYATEGGFAAYYVIVSTRDPDVAEIRCFRIAGGEVTEAPFEIVGQDA